MAFTRIQSVSEGPVPSRRFASVLEVALTHPRHHVMGPLLRDVLAAFLQRLQESKKRGRRDIICRFTRSQWVPIRRCP